MGAMLPTSTRTRVSTTRAQAVRYPPLKNREMGDQWIVGTHSSGGLEGLVGGNQSHYEFLLPCFEGRKGTGSVSGT